MTEHQTSGVSADAKILTRDGEKPIADLEGQTLDVWNGKAFEPMTIKRSGQAKLCRARFEHPNGTVRILDCTDGIRVPVGNSTIAMTEAHPFLRLRPFTLPGEKRVQAWSLVGVSKRAAVADVYATSSVAVINGLLIGF